jgi:elongation factor G
MYNPYNVKKGIVERFGSLVLLQGKTQVSVPKVHAGDIVAVAKLKETQTGDTLTDKAHPSRTTL